MKTEASLRSRIIIAGGSGFLGSAITPAFVNRGYEVVVLTRTPGRSVHSDVRQVGWDGKSLDDWAAEVDGAHAIINLAGRSVDVRLTPETRAQLVDSRVDTTRVLGDAVARSQSPPAVWIQNSAVGYYGDAGDEVCTESSPAGQDFLANIVESWEAAFRDSLPATVRGVLFRTGFVLGADGGGLQKLESLARWGLGGTVGTGDQFMSWIRLEDVVGAFVWADDTITAHGTYNLCAPNPARNADFMRELRSAVGRPWSPPVPGFAVRVGAALIGTQPELALHGQRCSPRLLQDAGFSFAYPDLKTALKSLIS